MVHGPVAVVEGESGAHAVGEGHVVDDGVTVHLDAAVGLKTVLQGKGLGVPDVVEGGLLDSGVAALREDAGTHLACALDVGVVLDCQVAVVDVDSVGDRVCLLPSCAGTVELQAVYVIPTGVGVVLVVLGDDDPGDPRPVHPVVVIGCARAEAVVEHEPPAVPVVEVLTAPSHPVCVPSVLVVDVELGAALVPGVAPSGVVVEEAHATGGGEVRGAVEVVVEVDVAVPCHREVYRVVPDVGPRADGRAAVAARPPPGVIA